jgi:hypothetical protein
METVAVPDQSAAVPDAGAQGAVGEAMMGSRWTVEVDRIRGAAGRQLQADAAGSERYQRLGGFAHSSSLEAAQGKV